MTSSAAIDILEQLLLEEPVAAAERANRQVDLTGSEIVLYGAGTLGSMVLERMRRVGLSVAAFADDTPEKQGTVMAGVPVMTARDAAAEFGDRALFVVTILNPLLRYLDARTRLQALTSGRIVSFLDVAWMFPEHFLPHYQFERPETVLRKRDDILRAARVFSDEQSREQFAAHMRFRLHLDHEALPPNSHDDYVPAELLPLLDDGCIFVDCGAFDGDTVRRFLAARQGRFGQVHAFEPDSDNCERLRRYVSSLPAETGSRIHVHCAAVGDHRGTLRFNTTGNMSSAFDERGSTEVPVVRIDETVPADGGRLYVKYDVEGAEWEAIRGTSGLLHGERPLLAVSVYHRPDDLWQLPLYLHSLGLGYELYLRTQGEDGMDVICYAL
ncbi:MAG: FkbM family methyltransferase [Acidobacteriota bacterium]